jgi:hypothetical protein
MTRIEIARLRAERTKRALAALAVAGFLTVVLLARDSHAGSVPAGSGSTATSGAVSSGDVQQGQDDFYLGPSTGTPQAQTHVS